MEVKLRSEPAAGALGRLRSRQPVFGVLQTIPAPALTQLAVSSGCDFVILDCEHGIVDEQAHTESLRIIAASDAFAAVRVQPSDFAAVTRYLRLGADAILLPDVRTAIHAATFVEAATQSANGGREPPLLFAMIEAAEAVANVGAIAATPGLSGLVIGPSDLSADLGCADDFSSAAYTNAFAAIGAAAAGAGLILGSRTHPGFSIPQLLRAGHRFILASVDVAALRDGFQTQLAAARQTI